MGKIKQLRNEKVQELISLAFKSNKSKIEFCNSEFEISCPNFDGGYINSNCIAIEREIDLKILQTVEENYLKDIEKDIDYLKMLITQRKKELLQIKKNIEVVTLRTKSGNKRRCSVYVREDEIAKDIYGNYKVVSSKYLEEKSKTFSDTKPNQKEIDDYIKLLEEEFNI